MSWSREVDIPLCSCYPFLGRGNRGIFRQTGKRRSTMEQPGAWRELLGMYITSPRERQRIANALDVRPITLARWANGESLPRQRNLHQLIAAFPPADRDPVGTVRKAGFSPAEEEAILRLNALALFPKLAALAS